MNDQAKKAGISVLISMGSSPGVANLLAKFCADSERARRVLPSTHMSREVPDDQRRSEEGPDEDALLGPQSPQDEAGICDESHRTGTIPATPGS